MSNAQAASAASGGGAADETVSNITANLAGEGQYRALSQIYQSEQSAINTENQARMSRYEGKQAARAGRMEAMGTILKGGSQLFAKYGGDGSSSVIKSGNVSYPNVAKRKY